MCAPGAPPSFGAWKRTSISSFSERLSALVANGAAHVVRVDGRRRGPGQRRRLVGGRHRRDRPPHARARRGGRGGPPDRRDGGRRRWSAATPRPTSPRCACARPRLAPAAVVRRRRSPRARSSWASPPGPEPARRRSASSRAPAGEFRARAGGRIERWLETTLDLHPGLSGGLVVWTAPARRSGSPPRASCAAPRSIAPAGDAPPRGEVAPRPRRRPARLPRRRDGARCRSRRPLRARDRRGDRRCSSRASSRTSPAERAGVLLGDALLVVRGRAAPGPRRAPRAPRGGADRRHRRRCGSCAPARSREVADHDGRARAREARVTALAALSQDLADLVARAAPAVVGVEHRRGQGSGVVLAQDGYVLTNAHVARGGGPLRVRLSGARVARRGWWGATSGPTSRCCAPRRATCRSLAALRAAAARGRDRGRDREPARLRALGDAWRRLRALPEPRRAWRRAARGARADRRGDQPRQLGRAARRRGRRGGRDQHRDAPVGARDRRSPSPRGRRAGSRRCSSATGEVRRPFLGIAARGEDLDPARSRGRGARARRPRPRGRRGIAGAGGGPREAGTSSRARTEAPCRRSTTSSG